VETKFFIAWIAHHETRSEELLLVASRPLAGSRRDDIRR
jgi:hypothetical protein